MERDLVLNGVRIGEYEFTPEIAIKKLKEESIFYGMNYASISACNTDYGKEFYVELARLLAEHKIYFDFNYFFWMDSPVGFDEETCQAMKDVAGEYYRAHAIPELGTKFSCAARGFKSDFVVPNKADDLQISQKQYDDYVNKIIARAQMGGRVKAYVIEPTMRVSCALHQDIDFPCVEHACGNPEIMLPLVRATARAMDTDQWMVYIANEWYGGTKNMDPLKLKRLKLYYDYAYISGATCFTLESGDEKLNSHDTYAKDGYIGDHPACGYYRKVSREFARLVREDFRPKGGPKVKVAFVQGNLDGYSAWRAGSSLWNRFDNPDFSYSEPEFVWRIFDDLRAKRGWCDVHNFGETDLSGAPAYGMYDVVPAWASYETLSRYDYLVFTGWNTMTEEIYANLKKYVQNGGRLFLTAAHLNTSTKRNGEMKLIHDGKVDDLFGCNLDASWAFETNDGIKFAKSIVPEYQYPASASFDPLLSEGTVRFAHTDVTSGVSTGRLSHAFADVDEMLPYIVENQCGQGYAVLMTTLDYPGGAAYPVYRTVVREMLAASHRRADVKIYGGDKLRFSVYEGNKVYLLNTDFDCRTDAVIEHDSKKTQILLEPMELRTVQL